MSKAIIGPPPQPAGPSPAQDLNDLYLFALVVKNGSFTAASRTARLSTSRISRRIAGLEERLGVRLLYRTTRKLSLTAVGEAFYQHCRAMVSEAEAAAEVVAHLQATPRGRVRVTCPMLSAQSVLGVIITDFMRKYTEVQLSVSATDRFVDLVDEGFDVAIRFRATPLEDSNLVARLIGEARTYLVASPTLLEQRGRPQSPAELTRLPSLGKLRHDLAYAWQLTDKNGQRERIPYQPLLDSDDWLVIKHAALAGLGVVAMPDELCIEEVAAGKLEIVLPAWALPSAALHIVYASRRGLIPAVRVFIDYMAERLSEVCRKQPTGA